MSNETRKANGTSRGSIQFALKDLFSIVLAAALVMRLFHWFNLEASILCCIALVPIAYCYGWRGFAMTAAWIAVLMGALFVAILYGAAILCPILRASIYW